MGLAFDSEKRYRDLLERLKYTGDTGLLVEALILIPDIVRDAVNQIEEAVTGVKADVKRVSSELVELRTLYETLKDEISELNAKQDEINKRLSRVENLAGGLTEAVLSRLFLEELAARGFRVRSARRNYRVNDEDVDLLVEADKEGSIAFFVVEVKVKPKHSDVGALLAKAHLVEAREGAKVRPVLAGVWIGGEVEAYARSQGVEVFKL